MLGNLLYWAGIIIIVYGVVAIIFAVKAIIGYDTTFRGRPLETLDKL